jgi:hypothetical protein
LLPAKTRGILKWKKRRLNSIEQRENPHIEFAVFARKLPTASIDQILGQVPDSATLSIHAYPEHVVMYECSSGFCKGAFKAPL